MFCVCKLRETGRFTDVDGKFILSPVQIHVHLCETTDTPTLNLDNESCNI